MEKMSGKKFLAKNVWQKMSGQQASNTTDRIQPIEQSQQEMKQILAESMTSDEICQISHAKNHFNSFHYKEKDESCKDGTERKRGHRREKR